MSSQLPRARPLVIAHRGASATWAEHTRAAMRQAIDDGADGLECDVRLTRDGKLVCLHDRSIDRTSDGRGAISTMALADLRGVDFGSWHGDPASTGILTLAELLDLVREAGRPVRLFIETKHPNRFGGRLETELLALLERFGLNPAAAPAGTTADAPPVTVMSFATTAVRRVVTQAPGLPTVLLKARSHGRLGSPVLPAGVNIVGVSLQLLRDDPGYAGRARALGQRVYVWTVDQPEDMSFVIGLDVDAIITNRPADLVALLGPRL